MRLLSGGWLDWYSLVQTDTGFVIRFIMNGISKVFFGIRMGNCLVYLSTRVIQLPRLTDFTSFLSSPVFPGLPGRLLVMDTLLHTSQLSALTRHNSCQPINFFDKKITSCKINNHPRAALKVHRQSFVLVCTVLFGVYSCCESLL